MEALLRALPGVWQETWRADCVRLGILNAGGLALVAYSNGTLIGFLCAHDVGFRAYLSEFAVAAEWQGKGVGSALLQRLETALRARGCALLVADVFPPAQGFYQKHGWGSPRSVLLSRRFPIP